ncbi:MAG: ABC transporter permease [Candidatus Margulisbacteria bacterium]|nr:ABC transporter permease [Candidatus Margulisiibacteriota bacterium]MBU1022006.1 ABC transporter permease [Candidatus Margulisiibacteriota bacterium]MBU1729871.1 ABC transporter permease [Candidatus Margulisiibacteriota bacterium]MBU1955201.1 ABC transporter permease [Candidatus Margulisiibacteriota bacterium]
MRKFVIRRLLQLIPLLIGISLISFFVIHLAPGDPTNLFVDPSVQPEELARIRANFGLDKPVIVQYFYWLKNVLRGDFGTSYFTGKPVVLEIAERLPATLLLMVSSMLITLIITIPLGVYSAVKKGKFFDQFFTVFSFAGMAIPSFWLGLMLMLLFAVQLHWFPAVGMFSYQLKDAVWYIKALDVMHHMFLPLLTMTILSLAGMSRYQRAAMLEVLKEEYIKTARAKGLPEKVVIFKHALRNALIPTVTILGLSLSGLFSGAFIIETIFAWPGMGRLGVQAIFSRNYPLIMGVVMLSAVLIALGNLLADIGYALVDPRIRYGKK